MDEYANEYATAAPAEPPARPAFLNRFWMVFVQPGKLFESLARNPAWFPITAFVAVATGIITAFIPFELYEAQMAAAGTAPDDLAAAESFLKFLIVGGTVVVLPVFTVAVAAMTYVIFVFMRGDEATYKQHLCVVGHAGILTLAGAAVTLPVQIAAGDIRQGLSLGTFAPFLPDGFLLAFLSSLPLFQLWAVAVTGIGIAAIDSRRSAGATIAVLMVVQVIVALACAGFVTAVTPNF